MCQGPAHGVVLLQYALTNLDITLQVFRSKFEGFGSKRFGFLRSISCRTRSTDTFLEELFVRDIMWRALIENEYSIPARTNVTLVCSLGM